MNAAALAAGSEAGSAHDIVPVCASLNTISFDLGREKLR